MPRLDYKTCKGCGRPSTEVGTLSHSRLCITCAVDREESNNFGISRKSGPEFHRWRQQMAACVGGVLLDDARPGGHTGGHARTR
jgi:hypothetical protein